MFGEHGPRNFCSKMLGYFSFRCLIISYHRVFGSSKYSKIMLFKNISFLFIFKILNTWLFTSALESVLFAKSAHRMRKSVIYYIIQKGPVKETVQVDWHLYQPFMTFYNVVMMPLCPSERFKVRTNVSDPKHPHKDTSQFCKTRLPHFFKINRRKC